MDILLVDDDRVDRMAIKRSLQNSELKYRLTEVETVDEAVVVLSENSFDILLLDYYLPVKNGTELLLEIKKVQAISDLTILMISNHHSEELLLQCLDLGVQEFLNKDEITGAQLKRAIVQAERRKELEAELYHNYIKIKSMAERDKLTGLYNRHYFESICQRIVIAGKARYRCCGIVFFDISNFKRINDLYGHEFGDKLLQLLGSRLQAETTEEDVISRFNGDEFACLLVTQKSPLRVKLEVERILRKLKEAYSIGENSISCTINAGVSLCPAHGKAADALIRFAGIALFRAKAKADSEVCIFQSDMESTFQRTFKIERELASAIDNDELQLAYQPIVDTESLQVVALETLIRWPLGNTTCDPSEFIPVAEESKLINSLGRWIISQALAQFAGFKGGLGGHVGLSINLSPVQLKDRELVKFISATLKREKLWANLLTFEITETALLENEPQIIKTLNEIHQLGCSIALDDFGTGYSSISHLLHFPIDIVKIDKSITSQITETGKGITIFRGLVRMLNTLSVGVVAEGVENHQQYLECKSTKVARIQGYYFSSAVSESSIVHTIKSLNREMYEKRMVGYLT